MKALTITDQQARKFYKSEFVELKEILEATYGKDFFSRKITDRIKTFEDACTELNISPQIFNSGAKDEIAYKKLKIIVQVLNEGWTPDWTDSDQYKYYPWFDMSSGSGLVCNGCDGWYACTTVGSRLCFKSRELAEYAGKQFIEIYKDFMII